MNPTKPSWGSLDVDALYDAGSLFDRPLADIAARRERMPVRRFRWRWIAFTLAGGAVALGARMAGWL